ncbi:Dynein light chain Tctex-type [Diplonema papillatum]|nr:Dynein light chain Tctex-type [Diplonema papillatum]
MPSQDVQQELKVVADCVDKVITPSLSYNHATVGGWVDDIVKSSMQALMTLKMPRKYIVQCTILQKSGAGLHTNTACYWDDSADGCFTHRTEGRNMLCVTTVYGIAL